MLSLTHFTDQQLQSFVTIGVWAGLGVAILATVGGVVPAPIIRFGALFLTLLLGVAGFIGGLASNVLTQRSNDALSKAYRAVSARTIQPGQVEALRSSLDECGGAVNVQLQDKSDPEQLSLWLSLKGAFHDAGYKDEPFEIPTLIGTGGGQDLTLYVPNIGLVKGLSSPLYKTLSSFGWLIGYNEAAFDVPADTVMDMAEEAKHYVKPGYCIVFVNNRPPAHLLGPTYFGHPG